MLKLGLTIVFFVCINLFGQASSVSSSLPGIAAPSGSSGSSSKKGTWQTGERINPKTGEKEKFEFLYGFQLESNGPKAPKMDDTKPIGFMPDKKAPAADVLGAKATPGQPAEGSEENTSQNVNNQLEQLKKMMQNNK